MGTVAADLNLLICERAAIKTKYSSCSLKDTRSSVCSPCVLGVGGVKPAGQEVPSEGSVKT